MHCLPRRLLFAFHCSHLILYSMFLRLYFLYKLDKMHCLPGRLLFELHWCFQFNLFSLLGRLFFLYKLDGMQRLLRRQFFVLHCFQFVLCSCTSCLVHFYSERRHWCSVYECCDNKSCSEFLFFHSSGKHTSQIGCSTITAASYNKFNS